MKVHCLCILLFFITTLAQKWEKIELPDDERVHIIYPHSKDEIWIGGEDGMLCFSGDGGISWEEIEIPSGLDIRDIYFRDSKIGYLVTADKGELHHGSMPNGAGGFTAYTREEDPETKILFTRDGGLNWDIVFEDDETYISEIRFTDHKDGIAFGEIGRWLTTKNGGLSWGVDTVNFNDDKSFKSGFSWGDGDNVMVTDINSTFWFNDSSFLSVGDNFHVGYSGDAAKNWIKIDLTENHERLSPPNGFVFADDDDYDLYAVSYQTDKIACVVGEDGFLARTIDGGKVWNLWELQSGENLHALQFSTANIGWVVGDDGVVLKSLDRGMSWKRVDLNTENDFYAVYFFPDGTGFVAGEEGELFHYSLKREIVFEQKAPEHFHKKHEKLANIKEITVVDSKHKVIQGVTIEVTPASEVVIDGNSYGVHDTLHVQLPVGEHSLELHKEGMRSLRTTVEQEPSVYDDIDHTMKDWSITMIGSGTLGGSHWGYGFGVSMGGGILKKNHRFMGVVDMGYGGLFDDGVQWEDTTLDYFTSFLGAGVEYAYNGFPRTPAFSLVPRVAVGYWRLTAEANLSVTDTYGTIDNEDEYDKVVNFFLRPGVDLEFGEKKMKVLLGMHGFVGEEVSVPTFRGGVRVRFN